MKKKILYLGIITVGMIVVLILGFFLRDKLDFSRSEKSIDSYLNILSSSADHSARSVNNYCDYSHQKYAQSLNCHLDSSLIVTGVDEKQKAKLLEVADEKLGLLSLSSITDITAENQKYISPDYRKSLIGKKYGLNCSVHYITVKNEIDTIKFNVSCAGLAKHAWYPIKG